MESSGAPSHQTVVRISWGQTHWDLTLWALLRVGTAASLRLRRSRPPAQGCGRQTATLGPHPSTRFNPDGVAAHPSFSHSSRPEPLRGSMVPPPIPRVGLIPFGRPWAGGRKPFGLRGRPPFHRLPRGGRGGRGGALNDSTRQHGPAHHTHGGSEPEVVFFGHNQSAGGGRQTVVRISRGQIHWDRTLWALLSVGTAASLRLRRSRPPAQGCGRQTATLGPHPSTRFNPNGVAAHPSFSHSSRPEPLRGSMVPPPIPRRGRLGTDKL
jgi:hypothetical protein